MKWQWRRQTDRDGGEWWCVPEDAPEDLYADGPNELWIQVRIQENVGANPCFNIDLWNGGLPGYGLPDRGMHLCDLDEYIAVLTDLRQNLKQAGISTSFYEDLKPGKYDEEKQS